MLSLTRKPGEEIRIRDDITIVVLATSGGRVRLGIEAPSDVRIVRGELPVYEVSSPSGDLQLAELVGDV